jgi:hypothetical protein
MVGDKAANPQCRIDTSKIKTLKDAKAADPPCEVDQFPAICPQVRWFLVGRYCRELSVY